MKILTWLEDEAHRALLYRALLGLIPLLVAVGFLTSDQAQQALSYAGLLLGFGTVGLAAKHTKRRKR